MRISAPFAQVLAAGRRQFNARVEEARRRVPSFDPSAFSTFLVTGVDCVVVAVEAVTPERTTAVTLAAYDIALDLCLQDLAGPIARKPLLNETWRRVFPALARRIAEQPQDVLGALSNAAVHLSSIDGARGEEWLERMATLGPAAESVGQLLDLGKVLAWRSGLAHFRAGALAAADALPPALQLSAIGAPPGTSWSSLRAALASDPWASLQARRNEGWQVGSFTGFGGRFIEPPDLRVAQDGFLLRSGARHFLAVADAFGAVLLPATAEEFEAGTAASSANLPRRAEGRLVFADRELAMDLPTESLSLAANAHTVAVASPYAHAVRLLPLR
jgi:hypothetical protein